MSLPISLEIVGKAEGEICEGDSVCNLICRRYKLGSFVINIKPLLPHFSDFIFAPGGNSFS